VMKIERLLLLSMTRLICRETHKIHIVLISIHIASHAQTPPYSKTPNEAKPLQS
jgi:hypothetical protein